MNLHGFQMVSQHVRLTLSNAATCEMDRNGAQPALIRISETGLKQYQ